MRLLYIVGALALVGCADPFAAASRTDTIEAYETYLAENPSGRFALQAQGRLETLMLEKAKEEASLETYDAYLERFPEGALRERAVREREAVLYQSVKKANTEEGWKRFLEEYPKAEKARKQFAQRMIEVHALLPGLSVGDVRVEQVNLAENPDGPLDGWGFEADVENVGSTTFSDVRLTLQWLSADERVVEEREWPLVAESWPVPIEEERKRPFKPGQTMTWVWTTGDVPVGWDRKARVFVSRLVAAR